MTNTAFSTVCSCACPNSLSTRITCSLWETSTWGTPSSTLKNWKANQKRAGFLPEERAYFDKFFGDIGYEDVARKLAGEVPGPYTWWSYRGKAFDNDAGWRIDYHMATPALAAKAVEATVDRAASYDERFSDHAPLVVDYQL